MLVCGIELKGREAIISLLNFVNGANFVCDEFLVRTIRHNIFMLSRV